jgi:hypothetical protein
MGSARKITALIGCSAAFALVLIAAPAAGASFHVIKVRELFPGTAATPGSNYIELQMYAGGQNQVHFGTLRTYAANGSTLHSFSPSSDVGNAENQRTVLIADSDYATVFPSGPTPDATDMNLNLSPTGGAACWPVNSSPIDCVSWGAFTGNASLPSTAGSPVQGSGASGAISDSKAIIRSITPACSTLLEEADDSNDSATDFSEASPNPRSNASAILETACSSPVGGPGTFPTSGSTAPSFDLQAAIKKCKKRFPKGPKRKKCIRKAKQKAGV